jgi:hypothetical protein
VKNTDGIDPSVASAPEHASLGTGSTTVSASPIYFDGYVKNVAIVYNFLSPSDDNVSFKGGLSDPRVAGARSGQNMLWAIDGNRDVSSNRTYGIVVAHNHSYTGHGLSVLKAVTFDNLHQTSYRSKRALSPLAEAEVQSRFGGDQCGSVSKPHTDQ